MKDYLRKTQCEIVQDVFKMNMQYGDLDDTIVAIKEDGDDDGDDDGGEHDELVRAARLAQFQRALRIIFDITSDDMWTLIMHHQCITLPQMEESEWSKHSFFTLALHGELCDVDPLQAIIDTLFTNYYPNDNSQQFELQDHEIESRYNFWHRIDSQYGVDNYLFRIALSMKMANPQTALKHFSAIIQHAFHSRPRLYKIMQPSSLKSLESSASSGKNTTAMLYNPSTKDEF
jgi:hypothetical protein